jgi:hypothetical protein
MRSDFVFQVPREITREKLPSEAPALSSLCARRGTRRRNLSTAEDEVWFCVPGTERENSRETAVSFMLSRRGRERGSHRQSRRGTSEETVTPEIKSESCNSRYNGEWVAKPDHAHAHALILFSTSQYGRMKSNHISRVKVWSVSNPVQILNVQQLHTVEFYWFIKFKMVLSHNKSNILGEWKYVMQTDSMF